MSLTMRHYAVLASLAQEPHSGYDIAQWFADVTRHFCAFGHSSIYPTLADVEAIHNTIGNAHDPLRELGNMQQQRTCIHDAGNQDVKEDADAKLLRDKQQGDDRQPESARVALSFNHESREKRQGGRRQGVELLTTILQDLRLASSFYAHSETLLSPG
jgi:hypothetical protein